jgi:hypothetical protein
VSLHIRIDMAESLTVEEVRAELAAVERESIDY